jgi:hypothetical protein
MFQLLVLLLHMELLLLEAMVMTSVVRTSAT